jgi:hypothetical protein
MPSFGDFSPQKDGKDAVWVHGGPLTHQFEIDDFLTQYSTRRKEEATE